LAGWGSAMWALWRFSEFSLILEQRISVRLDPIKVLFSALSGAIWPLFIMLLRRIQNVSPFGRCGIRNVSPARIFGILRNSIVFVSPTLEAGFERNSAVSASPEVKMILILSWSRAIIFSKPGENGTLNHSCYNDANRFINHGETGSQIVPSARFWPLFS
jgi:hypothetical protein